MGTSIFRWLVRSLSHPIITQHKLCVLTHNATCALSGHESSFAEPQRYLVGYGMWGSLHRCFSSHVCTGVWECLCRCFLTWFRCGGPFPCEEILNLKKLWTFFKNAFYVPILIMSTVSTNSCTVLPDYYRKHIHTTQLKLKMYCTSLPLYSPSYHFNNSFISLCLSISLSQKYINNV